LDLGGVLPLSAFCGGAFLAKLVTIWKPFDAKICRALKLAIFSAVFLTMAAMCGAQIYHDRVPEAPDDDELPLDKYKPFAPDTLAKSLTEESTLKFWSDFPRLDGATALYPLYSAFARATYPEADYGLSGDIRVDDEGTFFEDEDGRRYSYSNVVVCSKTNGAVERLLIGYADVIFVMDISDEAAERAEQLGIKLKLAPIGKEAFVFFVNKLNAIENLTTQNIIDIYSGKVKNWRKVGGPNNAIRAYQRPEGSGSQTALQKLMGDAPIMSAPQKDVYATMGGIYKVVANYKNYKNSLGYSFRYYLKDMIGGEDIKLLSIDGVAPNEETIASGEYPFADNFYAVTVERERQNEADARRAKNAEKFVDWILSAQGRELVKATGYAPIDAR
jgi:phosphate transport system substrate-binding protein